MNLMSLLFLYTFIGCNTDTPSSQKEIQNETAPLQNSETKGKEALAPPKTKKSLPAAKEGFVATYLDIVIEDTSKTDEEIQLHKGYLPELPYENRKEILMSFKTVDSVIPSPWLITMDFFEQSQCDFLIHGEDNSNIIPSEKLIIVPRTKGISSSKLRERAHKNRS